MRNRDRLRLVCFAVSLGRESHCPDISDQVPGDQRAELAFGCELFISADVQTPERQTPATVLVSLAHAGMAEASMDRSIRLCSKRGVGRIICAYRGGA
jgi:hypothetical protein